MVEGWHPIYEMENKHVPNHQPDGESPDNDRTKKSGIATSFCMVTGWKEGGFFIDTTIVKKIPVNVEFKTSTIFAIDSIDSFCKESWLLQNDSPSKKHTFYKMAWLTRKMSLQNASLC